MEIPDQKIVDQVDIQRASSKTDKNREAEYFCDDSLLVDDDDEQQHQRNERDRHRLFPPDVVIGELWRDLSKEGRSGKIGKEEKQRERCRIEKYSERQGELHFLKIDSLDQIPRAKTDKIADI